MNILIDNYAPVPGPWDEDPLAPRVAKSSGNNGKLRPQGDGFSGEPVDEEPTNPAVHPIAWDDPEMSQRLGGGGSATRSSRNAGRAM